VAYRQSLGVSISLHICDELLQRRVSDTHIQLERLRETDPIAANSLSQLLSLPPHALEALDLTFEWRDKELMTGGRSIKVEPKNVGKFVSKVLSSRDTASETSHLAKGFKSVLNANTLKYITPEELKYIILGDEDINVAMWKKHSIVSYDGGIMGNTQQVDGWFWSVVEEMSSEEKKDLLGFWSGSRVPPLMLFDPEALLRADEEGRWSLTYTPDQVTSLPSVSVCNRHMTVPMYTSREQLKTNLLTAIRYGAQGYYTT
jgi:E3 ubiquitin-protein ligase EDD1